MTAPEIHHGDCLSVMAAMETDSIDAIVTDPPYGLGFMGKKWDALPPSQEWARECLRVLKPGGHLLAFGGTRTWHRLAVAVEDAGFEIRDSIAWMYGSGFPKHRAALKPAFEPIVMGRKPFKGSLTANEAAHGTGALNIEACRIGHGKVQVAAGGTSGGWIGPQPAQDYEHGTGRTYREGGRWPANVILDDTTAAILDEQSGISKSPSPYIQKTHVQGDVYGLGSLNNKAGKVSTHHGDTGGASRFFYVAKAPKRERPIVDGVAHPTVKPLALMRWLCRLVTPEGGTILDPFAGSGTTLEAAALEGYDVIGVEAEADYLPLIQKRLERTNGAA